MLYEVITKISELIHEIHLKTKETAIPHRQSLSWLQQQPFSIIETNIMN